MTWLSPRSRRVSIPLGNYIPVQGTGHTTLGGQCYGSTLLRCVNPKSLQKHSLSQLRNTKAQPVTLTLNVFYGSTWLGLPNPASCAYLMSDQDIPPHSQWISNVLLHSSWANRTPLDFDYAFNYVSGVHEIPILTDYTVPLNASPNRLLVWCIFLGSPVEEEALKVQDK